MSEWVILELSSRAEGEDPDIVRRSIRNFLRSPTAEVFLPAAVTQIGDDRVVQYLVEGYAFIRKDLLDQHYLRLENSRYVQSVVTSLGTIGPGRAVRRLASIGDADIERMRSQIQVESNQGIGVGDTVRVVSGVYKNISAIVIEDIPELDKVQVEVRLRSKESLVTLPRSFLQLISKAPRPPYLDKIESLRNWLSFAELLVRSPKEALREPLNRYHSLVQMNHWLRDGEKLTQTVRAFSVDTDPKVSRPLLGKVSSLTAWIQRGRDVWGVINACQGTLDFDPIQRKHLVFERLFRWISHGNQLTKLLPLLYSSLSVSTLEAKYLELGWLQDVIERMYRIEREVDALGRSHESRGGTSVQNIIIDGHNLAFRCLYAPGMSALANTQGHPTGMIVGFLRSLASLKKRHPDAHICVCWDGSPKRRRQLFAGYKASRGERADGGGFDQMAWLRATLSFLGVEQAHNPEEEADDVIAALVRGMFKGQRNLILSTDRDFLQLVTRTDYQLVPSVGGKKEILYDVDAVVRDYGVPPERMVLLRAFLGDTSDEIPGVPRVPTKILTNLVRLYSSVDKVYSSSLAGLTKSQYEKLREAEAQVRLNVRLMSLDTGTTFVLTRPDPNQIVAQERLQDVEMKAAPILAAFFDRAVGSEEQRVENDERLRDSGRPG